MGIAGYIGRVLSFTRKLTNQSANVNTCKVDAGGNNLRTVTHMSASGDDSPPLSEDYAVSMPIPRSANAVVVGYTDTRNAGIAEPGEKRIYSRDSDGVIKSEIHLKGDGTVVIKNDNGVIELAPSGVVTINQNMSVDDSGNVQVQGTITANAATIGGIDFASHTHGGVESGGSSTGVPQ